MASLAALSRRVPDVLAQLFEALRAAELARPREQHAAIVIQKYARGFLTQRRLDKLTDQVVCIQRCWRGYLGRQQAKSVREARDKRLREAYFAAMAITIQRHWRGFWSRKYIFDFKARKRYLQRVAQVNAKMREVLAEEGDRAAHTQKALAETAAHAAFAGKVSKLHHLLSTSSQPGVFASPYQIAAGTVPVVAGAPVEEHLRAAFRKTPPQGTGSQAMQRGTTFLPPIKGAAGVTQPDSAGTGTQRNKGSPTGTSGSKARTGRLGSTAPRTVFMGGLDAVVPVHATLRQVVPYNALHQAELLEAKVIKAEMLTIHPLPFRYAGKPEHPQLGVQSNRNLLSYEDPWDPTVGVRNETFTPRQQITSPTPFDKYGGHCIYFDEELQREETSTTLAPKTYSLHLPDPPSHAAGVTVNEIRRMAREPPRP